MKKKPISTAICLFALVLCFLVPCFAEAPTAVAVQWEAGSTQLAPGDSQDFGLSAAGEGGSSSSSTDAGDTRWSKLVPGFDYIEGEVVVTLVDDATEETAEMVAEAYGFTLSKVLCFGDWKGGKIVLVSLPEGVSVPDAIDALNGDSYVKYAEPNLRLTLFDWSPSGNEGEEGLPVSDTRETDWSKLVPGFDYIEGEVVVTLVDDATEETAEMVAEAYGFTLSKVLCFGDWKGGKIVLVSLPEGVSVPDAIDILSKGPNVAYAEPNLVLQLFEGVNDPDVDEQWYLDALGVYDAWDIGKAEGEVTVAVFDTGVNMQHPDLAGNILSQYAWDAYNGQPLSGDFESHGTRVAGVISAVSNNGIGISGVSYNAKILPVRICDADGKLSMSATVSAFDYVLQDVSIDDLRVINISAGRYDGYYATLESCVNEAAARGIVTVCAAGNSNTNAACYPSDYAECVSVVATDSSNNRWQYSNYGWAKDIAAPGVGIRSTTNPTNSSGSYYDSLNGTSLSAPIVSGTLALMFATNPSLTVSEAKNILYSSATDLGAAGRDDQYGWGLVNVRAALEYSLDGPFEHIQGTDRYFTMQNISRTGWAANSCGTVVLATGASFPDALAGSGIAGLDGSPILLTGPDHLSTQARSEIFRLGAGNVVILGGTSAVSTTVENEAKAIVGASHVTRISGASRQETAYNIYAAGAGSWSNTAIVAAGATPYDALSVAPYAYANSSPVFLTDDAGALSPQALAAIAGDFDRVVLVGGTSVVSASTESALAGQLGSGNVLRLAGADRYATSRAIAAWLAGDAPTTAFQPSTTLSYDGMTIASGADGSYADGLAGGPLAGASGAVQLLAEDSLSANPVMTDVVAPNKDEIESGYVLGGTACFSDAFVARLNALCL